MFQKIFLKLKKVEKASSGVSSYFLKTSFGILSEQSTFVDIRSPLLAAPTMARKKTISFRFDGVDEKSYARVSVRVSFTYLEKISIIYDRRFERFHLCLPV